MALAAGETAVAEHLALQLVTADYSPAWRLAAALAAPHLVPALAPLPTPVAEEAPAGQQEELQSQQLQEQEESQQEEEQGQLAVKEGEEQTAEGLQEDLHSSKRSSSSSSRSASSSRGSGSHPGGSESAGGMVAAAGGEAGGEEEGWGDGWEDAEEVGEEAEGAPMDEVQQQQQQEQQEQQQDVMVSTSTPGTAPAAPQTGATRSSKGSGSGPNPSQRVLLLAFATRYCQPEDLAGFTDELTAWRATDLHRQDASLPKPAAAMAGPYATAGPYSRPQQLAVALEAQGSTAVDRVPSLGDAHMAVAGLLGGGSSSSEVAAGVMKEAVADLLGGKGTSSSSKKYAHVERLLLLGSASQLLLALKMHAAAAIAIAATSEGQQQQQEEEQEQGSSSEKSSSKSSTWHQQQQKLLDLATCSMFAAAEQLHEELKPLEAEAVAAAVGFRSQLQQLSESRALQQLLPPAEAEKFIAGGPEYQLEVCCDIAANAGQQAAVALGGAQPKLASIAQSAAAAAAGQGRWDSDQAGRGQGQLEGQGSVAKAEELFAEARKLAGGYGIDLWPLYMSYVHSVIAHAPESALGASSSSGEEVGLRGVVGRHWAVLLQRPGATAAHLYSQTYPLLPATASRQLSYVLGLILEALKPGISSSINGKAESAAADAGEAIQSSGANSSRKSSSKGEDVLIEAKVVQPVLQPLDQLRKLLDSSGSSKVLKGCSLKPLVAAHMAYLLGPCFEASNQQQQQQQQEEGEQEGGPGTNWSSQRSSDAGGGTSAAAAEEQLAETASATAGVEGASNRPPPAAAAANPAVDSRAIVQAAVSSLWSDCRTQALATSLAKLLKHLQVIADMLQRTDRSRYVAVAKVLREIPPGLPALVLACKMLMAPTSPAAAAADGGRADASRSESLGTEQQQQQQGSGKHHQHKHHEHQQQQQQQQPHKHHHQQQEGGWYEQYTREIQLHLSRMSPSQLAAFAAWGALEGQQPLPEEAVGTLVPLKLPDEGRLQLLADAIAIINAPADGTAGTAGVTLQPVVGGTAPGEVAGGGINGVLLPCWRPPAVAASLPPRRQQLLPPLLTGARQAAAFLLVNAVSAAAYIDSQTGRDLAVAAAREAGGAAAFAAEDVGVVAEGSSSSSSSSSLALHHLLKLLLPTGRLDVLQLLRVSGDLLQLLHASSSETTASSSTITTAAAAAGAGSVTRVNSSSSSLTCASGGGNTQCDIPNGAHGAGGATGAEGEEQQQQREQENVAAVAAVAAALQEVAGGVLQQLQQIISRWSSSNTAGHATPMKQLLVLVEVLDVQQQLSQVGSPAEQQQDNESPPEAAEGVTQLQQQLWDQLQGMLGAVAASDYSHPAVASLMELQAELAGPGGRWPGWKPAATAAGDGGGDGVGGAGLNLSLGLILARTMNVISRELPGVQVSRDLGTSEVLESWCRSRK